jgi:hypothetical protein
MEQAGPRVNWSAVACEAFESRLSELEKKESAVSELPDKDDALERLRRLKNEPEFRDRKEESRAYLLGKRWAMSDAHPNELERLDAFCRRYDLDRPVDQWKIDIRDRRIYKDLFRELTLSILGYDRFSDVEKVRDTMRPFWERRVGVVIERELRPDPEFLSGFTQGALSFWKDVKDRL